MFCAINNCGTNSSNGTIFNFPEDSSLRQKWMDVCRLQEFDIAPHQGVCHIHFKTDQIQTDPYTGSASLAPDMVPSLFLPTKRETSSSSSTGMGMSFMEVKKNEVNLVNGIQDQITQLIEINDRYKKKVCSGLQTLSQLEKEELRRFTDSAEQEVMMDQMLRLSGMTPFKLKKVNKVVDTDELISLVKKNGQKPRQTISSVKSDSKKWIENVLDDIDAMNFVSDNLNSSLYLIDCVEKKRLSKPVEE